jgi:ABC-2 type transport system permease protein
VLEPLVLYGRLIGARVRAQMQYRVSFVLSLVGSTVATLIEFGAIVVLFGRVSTIAGWSLGEVALLYALAETSFSTAELFGSALDDFNLRVAQGTFDRVLTRPRGAFFQVLAEDLALRRLGRVAQGVAVLVFATSRLDMTWTPAKLLVLLVALSSGVVIFFSIFVLAAAFCF